MPLLVPTRELQVGMRLHEPLFANKRILLQSGKPLTPADIEVLRRRYPELSLRVQDPVLDSVVEFEDDSRERQIASEAQHMVSKSMSEVSERFAQRAALRGTDFAVLQQAVNELLEYLKKNPASSAIVADCLDNEAYLCKHTGNVFYLSMLLGSKVREYVAAERKRQTAVQKLKDSLAEDLSALGLGAMVMDLGMLPLQKLLEKRDPLTDEEREAIRKHPEVGVELLPETFPTLARMIVRTHHENFAGTGYPKGLAGYKVHVFTRIVRIADAFSAATSERVYKGAKTPARTLWEMTAGPYKRFYDPKLAAAFASIIQPFPVGAKLTLKDGRIAVVIKYNRKHPFEPTVVITTDTDGNAIPQEHLSRPVCLASDRGLRIQSFRGEDLSYIYTGSTAGSGSVPTEFTTPLEAAYP